jgi:uncharacterized protein
VDPHLRRVVALDNRWLEGEPHTTWCARHLPATYLARRLVLAPDDRVTLLVGPRQCGKSTSIWKTLATSERSTLYLNCEEPSLQAWLRSPAAFLADLEEWLGSIPDLFFDEIQNLPEAGLFLKGLVDRKTGRYLFATGSSSFDLEAATRESLAGRASGSTA